MRDSATPSEVEGPSFEGKKVLVLGVKVTGRDTALVLAERGADVLASDAGEVSAGDRGCLAEAGVDVEAGSHDRARAGLHRFDFVVPSPGISPFSGFLADVVASDVPVVSELDLGARIATAPVVAVTGTNGKTTVVHLAAAMGREEGLDVHACGNLETKFVTAAHESPDADAFVVEASSFALAFCSEFHPRIAIVTSFAPDHLDWHKTIEHYRESKAKIAQRQTAEDLFLYPTAQPDLADIAPDDGPRRVAFGDVLPAGAEVLAQRGPHFGANAAGAAAAMAFLGVGAEAMEKAMRSFSFDRHRLEPVGTKGGVRFVDDSIATNTQAAVAALRSFHSMVVLIAGGRNKGLDLSPLASEARRLRALVTLGEAAEELERIFATSGVDTRRVGTMSQAVAVGIEFARPGDVVLLAPACASHDMFANYAERGRAFQDACHQAGVES